MTTQFEERPPDTSSGDSEETAKDKVVGVAGEALEQGKEKAGEVAGQARGAFARTLDERRYLRRSLGQRERADRIDQRPAGLQSRHYCVE